LTGARAVLEGAAAASPSRASRAVEALLLGGGTLVLFPLAWALRRAIGRGDAELAAGFLTFHLAFVLNDPHFSVTYLLFYRRALRDLRDARVAPAQRARLAIAGFVGPIVLAAWAGVALARHDAELLGGLVQRMYALVGWHYAKQGFGVLAVACARRGVTLSRAERWAFVVHAYAAWVFAWANPSMPAGAFEERGVVYHAIARPRALELAAGAVLAATTIAVVAVVATAKRREGRHLPAAPLVAVLVTIWLWTIFTAVDPVMRYLVPALHSTQYLYFVWLWRRNEARAHEGPPHFGRPAAVRVGALAASALALAWLLFHGAPGVLDAILAPRGRAVLASPLGPAPFAAAFYVVVNVHHYLMDHALWRRDNPDTRWLVRDG
jgi:hypothetical protein